MVVVVVVVVIASCDSDGGGERRRGDGVYGGAAVEERVAIMRINYSMKCLNKCAIIYFAKGCLCGVIRDWCGN